MDGLTELSEKVSDNLILGNIMSDYANGMNISRVKIIGPFGNSEFGNFKSHIPKGYRVTSKTEIEALITAYKKARKLMVFPIHAGVSVTVSSAGNRNMTKFTSTFYESEDKDAVEINLYNDYGIGTNEIPARYIYLVAD